MSVHWKPSRKPTPAPRLVRVVPPAPQSEVTARAILAETHPLNGVFKAWLKGKEATKRQAALFLQAYPQLRAAAREAA